MAGPGRIQVQVTPELDRNGMTGIISELQKVLGKGLKDLTIDVKDINAEGAINRLRESIEKAFDTTGIGKELDFSGVLNGTYSAIKEIASALNEVKTSLNGINSSISNSTIGEMVTRSAGAIGQMVAQLNTVNELIENINNKEFSITNNIQNFNKTGVDKSWFALQTKHATALRDTIGEIQGACAKMNSEIKNEVPEAWSKANQIARYSFPTGMGTSTGVIKGNSEMRSFIDQSLNFIDEYNAKVTELGNTKIPAIPVPDMTRVKETLDAIEQYDGLTSGVGGNATKPIIDVGKIDENITSIKDLIDQVGNAFDGIHDKITSAFDFTTVKSDLAELRSEVETLGTSLSEINDNVNTASKAKLSQEEKALFATQKSLLSAEKKATESVYQRMLSGGFSGDGIDGLKEKYSQWLQEINTISKTNAVSSNETIERLQREGDEIRRSVEALREKSRVIQENTDAQAGTASEKELENNLKLETSVINLRAQYQKFKQEHQEVYAKNSEEIEKNLQIMENAGAVTKQQYLEMQQAMARYAEEVQNTEKVEKSQINAEIRDANLRKQVANLQTRVSSFIDSNPKAYERYSTQLDSIRSRIAGLADLNGDELKSELAQISSEFANISTAASQAGITGQTFFQKLKSGYERFGGWSLVTKSFMSFINLSKKMVNAVKEVDAAMTELKKVTDLTDAGYADFYKDATLASKNVGASLSDTINATADFARLGYDVSDALDLAQAGLIYKNVGDGINDVSQATESLISTIKAFRMSASDAMSIVDEFNEVGKLLPMPVVTRCLAECYIGQSSVWLKCA